MTRPCGRVDAAGVDGSDGRAEAKPRSVQAAGAEVRGARPSRAQACGGESPEVGPAGTEGCAPRRRAPQPPGPSEDPELGPVVAICRALGEASRFSMLQLIARAGELCSCEVEQHFQLSQPTISHHLKLLRRAGLILGERRGTWIYYRVDPNGLARLASHPLLAGWAEPAEGPL